MRKEVKAKGSIVHLWKIVHRNKTAMAVVVATVLIASFSVSSFGESMAHSPKTSGPKAGSETSYTLSPDFGLFGSSNSIGLADAGVSNNGSYEYSTTSFLGSAHISELNTSGSLGTNMSFQLNLNLEFIYDGSTFVYWVQDVALLNTSDNNIQFIDNVWNFSSSLLEMHNSSISGNGTVYPSSDGNLYEDEASFSLPGSNVNLTEPYNVLFMMNSTQSSAGTPQVSFMYNDGSGWVTYDKVLFIFASGSGVTDRNFVVDGGQSNPEGLYYDAEFIMGGPGDGSSTNDNRSNVTMELQFWNGHNFQEITNAINYGLDTGESITNALSEAYYYGNNGTIYERVKNGTETTGVVYYSSNISILRVSSPFNSGELSINGTNHTFIGGQVNLTLGPGNYKVTVYNESLPRYVFHVDLKAGKTYDYYEGEYIVNFTENSLARGTDWWVTIDGMNLSSTSNVIPVHLPNGEYRYIPGPNDSVVKSSAGLVNVNGQNLNISVKFSYVLFNVTFRENGVRNNGSWGLLINNSISGVSSNRTLTFQLINGTYTYGNLNTSDYYLQHGNVSFAVNGAPETYNITLIPYSFIRGSIYPQDTMIELNGKVIQDSGSNYSLKLVSGNYSLIATSPGYHDLYYNFTVSDGQTILKNLSLSKIIYPLNLSPYIGLSVGVLLFALLYVFMRRHSKR